MFLPFVASGAKFNVCEKALYDWRGLNPSALGLQMSGGRMRLERYPSKGPALMLLPFWEGWETRQG